MRQVCAVKASQEKDVFDPARIEGSARTRYGMSYSIDTLLRNIFATRMFACAYHHRYPFCHRSAGPKEHKHARSSSALQEARPEEALMYKQLRDRAVV